MVRLEHTVHRLKKRVPLAISRGVRTESEVFHVRWTEEDVEGWGEAVPFGLGDSAQTAEQIVDSLRRLDWVSATSAWHWQQIERRLWDEGAPSAVISALVQAMLDWIGKRLVQPVHRLHGLGDSPARLTSVTIGISEPERAARRVREWLELHPFRAFKIKLGAPAGLAADQAMFEAVQASAPADSRLSVDANGGWTVEQAAAMATWLADRGVDHLEQPLRRGDEKNLATLRRLGALPVLVDESCVESRDIPALGPLVDGINIKLMKCGGFAEALRMIHTARAHGLRVLLGCYGNSALGNSCAAALGALADYVDLDSHLNLETDPFVGVGLRDGCLQLSPQPGFGVSYA